MSAAASASMPCCSLMLDDAVHTVTVHQVALSDEEGVAVMAVHADARGCDEIGGPVERGVETLEVETTSADVFQARHELPEPDVIKVDIEGHEPEALDRLFELYGSGE